VALIKLSLAVLTPVRNEAPAQRIEYFAGLVVAPDHQQVLARRAVRPGRIVVDAAIADVSRLRSHSALAAKSRCEAPSIGEKLEMLSSHQSVFTTNALKSLALPRSLSE
jgi:hypothetical protein